MYYWIDTNLMKGLLGWFGRNTIGRVYQLGNWIYKRNNQGKVYKYLSPQGMDLDEKIIEVQLRTVWIGGQFVSDLMRILSVFTCVLSGQQLKHWWVLGKARHKDCDRLDESQCAEHPDIWYHFMFNIIYMYSSYEEADMKGRRVCENIHQVPSTLRMKKVNVSLRDAVQYSQRIDGRYNLVHNNCQNYAEAIYNSFPIM